MLIGYVRTSTQNQNPQLQIDALIKEGIDPRNIFEDQLSGASTKRPALQKMLSYVKEGDVVVVWKLDRLARSLADLIDLINKFQTNRIGFKSLTENIDTTTPSGLLMFHLFGSLAQFEREIIRERIMAGLEVARNEGRKGGRQKSLSKEQVEIAINLKKEGAKITSISRILKTSRATVYRSLEQL